jgi:hypothetical protein
MKFQRILSLGLFLAIITIIACKKDEKTSNTNPVIVEKKGLQITGDQEVPAKTTSAYGSMDVSYNKTTKVLSFYATWTNLSGNPTGAHIHGPAAKGSNAGVKVDLASDVTAITGNITKTITVDNVALIEDSLLAGKYYFNIHTPTNPAGEIRGQIQF